MEASRSPLVPFADKYLNENVPIEWNIDVPGGPQPPLRMNGTVQEVYRNLKATNATLASLWLPNPPSDTAPEGFKPDLQPAPRAPAEFNTASDEFRIECFGNRQYADRYAIQEGIDHLRGVEGKPGNGPGPNKCGQVSCSWDSAIVWCNDDPNTARTLDSYGEIADYAQKILNQCQDANSQNVYNTAGEAYIDEQQNIGWRVQVERSATHC